jgi:hypothetical protein
VHVRGRVGDGTIRDRCDVCAFEWTIHPAAALDAIEAAPDRYEALLADRDGMVAPDDGRWNATAYIWHLTDPARSWSELWVQLADTPGSLLAGWDPDELAAARNHRNLPTTSALRALRQATSSFVQLSRQLDHSTAHQHGDWGANTLVLAALTGRR